MWTDRVRPAKRQVLTSVVDRVAEVWQRGIGKSRIGDVRLTKQIATEQLVLVAEGIVHTGIELVVEADPRLLIHKIRRAWAVGSWKSTQRNYMLRDRVNHLGRDDIAWNGIAHQNRRS